MKLRRFLSTIFLSALAAALAFAQKTISAPIFKSGETFFYLVHLKSRRDIKTKSAFVFPEPPIAATIDVHGVLQVEVLSADSSGTHLRTWFLNLVSDVESHPRRTKPDAVLSQHEETPAEGKFVDCTLLLNGQITQITGLDQLASEQQTAWQEWAARFAAAFLIESQSRKRGEKWSAQESETSPSPIAELLWQQKSHYEKDEPCAPQKFVRGGSFERSPAQESCSVILSTAALVQKSSAQDSTPPDYRLKGLKTRGTAKGDNDTVLYISRKTGRLIRARQNAKQQMDVTIVLADGSSAVHYAITADANSTVELVTELPLQPHTNP